MLFSRIRYCLFMLKKILFTKCSLQASACIKEDVFTSLQIFSTNEYIPRGIYYAKDFGGGQCGEKIKVKGKIEKEGRGKGENQKGLKCLKIAFGAGGGGLSKCTIYTPI